MGEVRRNIACERWNNEFIGQHGIDAESTNPDHSVVEDVTTSSMATNKYASQSTLTDRHIGANHFLIRNAMSDDTMDRGS